MTHKLLAPIFIATLALVASGNADVAQAKKARAMRIAMLAPRGSLPHREFLKMSKKLQKATNNEWTMKVYASGIAGDDTDVIRKMKVGQLDGGVITTVGMSHIVRAVAILDTPGVINSYKQLEAVQKEMHDEWDQMFLKANTKLLAMWEAGRYRFFSKGSANTLAEVRAHRAWLWPDSQVMKELWRTVGVTGVPLAINDVFGALQTGMVDLVVNTPVALVTLRWHLNLDHVSKTSAGVLLLSWVLNKPTWEAIPDNAKAEIQKMLAKTNKKYKADARKEDAKAFAVLLKRGYKVTAMAPAERKVFDDVTAKVRNRLAGRVYPKALLHRVMKITSSLK